MELLFYFTVAVYNCSIQSQFTVAVCFAVKSLFYELSSQSKSFLTYLTYMFVITSCNFEQNFAKLRVTNSASKSKID